MINDLVNKSYRMLTCIEHIRAHVANSIAGNANKIVQVIQKKREQLKFVLIIGGSGGRGTAPNYVRRKEKKR